MTFTKPPPLPTVLTCLGVLILCSLGTWQLQRLEWKQELIKTYSKNITTLTGKFVEGTNINIAPRTHEGKIGVHIYQLFESSNLQPAKIWVNRGWLPQNASGTLPKKTTIHGLLKEPDQPNMFTPQNDPAQGLWYWPKLGDMNNHAGEKNTHPQVFLEQYESAEGPPFAYQPRLKNDHLQYAFFWFTMAGILLSVFVLRFVVIKN